MKPTDFAKHLTEFLSVYLPYQKNVSKNTIYSYRDTFKLLIRYCQEKKVFLQRRLPWISFQASSLQVFWNGWKTRENAAFLAETRGLPLFIPFLGMYSQKNLKVKVHMFRHSKAMHLLQAGVNLIYIRDFLGHVDLKTTEIYARTDTETKRKAIENAYPDLIDSNLPDWSTDRALLSWLSELR